MIAPRLVLTSAHVVPDVDKTVTLFHPGRPKSWTGTVILRGRPGGRDDAALLHIGAADWEPPAGPSVRWGRLVTNRPGTAGEAWGIPDLVQRPGRATDTLQPSGTLNPGDRHVGNRYVMNLDQHAPASAPGGESPWGGLSGAALFCGDLLAGVIASDPAGRSHGHLEAVPAYVLLHDPTFRAALAKHGFVNTLLEPVEWQHLAEPTAAAGPVRSPAALLRARRQIVPFSGRTSHLQYLDAWTSEPGFGALLLHGPGGQGKTRLAQHFADLLTVQRWAVLWLRPDTAPDTLEVLAGAAVPLLVVVDYAETRPDQVATLLDAAARHSGSSPFKMLLLARTAGDWWQTLQASTSIAEDLLDGAGVIELPALGLEPEVSRSKAYLEALHAYARHLPQVRGWQHHDWPALADRLTHITPAKTRLGLETALSLHMTALADLLDQPQTDNHAPVEGGAKAAEASGVEDRLLAHERRYWANTAAATHGLYPALTMGTLTDALAAAFLLGAEDRSQADELLDRVPGLADQPEDRRRAVRDWIATLYPPITDTRPWDTLQPDRLTERFIGRHLQTDPDLVDRLIIGATAHQATQLLTIYTRAASHSVLQPDLGQHLTVLCTRHATTLAVPAIRVATQTETPQPLLNALHQITDRPDVQISDLMHLGNELPRTSHNLAPWAAKLTQFITDRHRTLVENDLAHLPGYATSLTNLAIRLGNLEQREEALVAVTEAVNIRRELAQTQPDAHRPGLAASLNVLSNRLSDLGRQDEALAPVTEAVKVYRELAQTQPDAHRPGLAASLNVLSNRLSDLGRQDEALAPVTEAVKVYRELAQTQPDAYRPDLATSLNNLSNRLSELGRQDEALAPVTEAVNIRRELAQTQPDAYRPDLAASLNNLSNRLGELGQQDEALAAVTEAVEVYRELARTQPDTHRPRLAGSLNNLSVHLGGLGRQEEALVVITEAVSIRRELAQTQPDAFRPYLAMSLNNLFVQLRNASQPEEALTAVTEAVEVYRELTRTQPDAHRPNLATSLNNLSVHLGSLGRREEALVAVTEAVNIRRELAQTQSDVRQRDLDHSLKTLTRLQDDVAGGSDSYA
ncbi:tetratricopeptide repeat protein (plasmid) [Streptomyces sp. Qhu-G9]|uniref:tetratricopeptide repeat protein n=1 Tax=Streptomyces sp. Qhu-G9 TaxID=3452799 RepID=UPI0022AC6C4F|nr:tetratricopeptide repeat protein [Streptomyces aurantiacus]WAU78372.1 tetratricopeptide repeat protein [Streptomyces aurantiacus]